MISQTGVRASEITALMKTAGTIATSRGTIDESLAGALDLVCAFTGWPLGHVYLVDEDSEQLVSTDIWHNDNPERFEAFVAATRHTVMPVGVGLPGRIIADSSSAWIVDVRTDRNFPRAPAALQCGLGCGIGFPIRTIRGVEGVLEFFASETAAADDALLDLLTHLGGELGGMLDRGRAEAALDAAERRLKDAERLARVGSWYYQPDTDVLTWSPELCDLHGIERKLAPTSFAEYLAGVHAEDLARVKTTIEHTISTGEPFEFEYRMVLPDGQVRCAHVQGQAVTHPSGGVMQLSGYCQDVTEQVRARDELLSSERRLTEAQRLAHLGSWNWDVTAGSITWSPELFRIYGVDSSSSPASFEGYIERVHPDDRERVGAAINGTLETMEPFEHDYRIVRPNGEMRRVHARGEVVESVDGVPSRLAGYCHDVTERALMEEKLRRAAEQERLVAEREREIEQTKNALLLAVSHELRTPLSVIVGIAGTLHKVEHDPELMHELIGRLRANCQKLQGSLADLLDVDRISRGVVAPRPRPTHLGDLVHRVLDGLAGDREVLVDVDDTVALVDPGLVERIVEQLVVTAIRSTDAGAHVWVAVASSADGALVKVEHDGDRIPDDLKAPIFEPFHQGMSVPHDPRTGVGLHLVSRFAELHGGRAWVEDRPGGGASFRVLLPEAPG